MTKHERLEFYAALVAEVERGSSVREVARRHDVAPKTLSWWRWKLRKESETRRTKSKASPAALVPVVVRGSVAQSHALVELSVAGCQIAFETGTDPAYVAALVRALTESC